MSAKEKIGKAGELLQSVAKPLATFLGFIIPPLFLMTAKAYKVFKTLPTNVAQFIIGACFCFFGGLYPTVFAAVQAAEHGGRKAVVQAISDLANEITVILEESKKDDKVDADKVRASEKLCIITVSMCRMILSICLHTCSCTTTTTMNTGWNSRCRTD